MRSLILIASLAATLAYGLIASAQAGQNCVTHCSNTSDGRSQNCQTFCN